MIVEATCRFCKHKLIEMGSPLYSKATWKVVSETKRCNRCMVTQTFTPEGRPLSYSFEVSPYILVFDLVDNQFTIRERAQYSNVLMKCDFIPNDLTPKTTTLEKIKTLILFS